MKPNIIIYIFEEIGLGLEVVFVCDFLEIFLQKLERWAIWNILQGMENVTSLLLPRMRIGEGTATAPQLLAYINRMHCL